MAALKRNLIFVLAAIITGLVSIAFGIGVVRATALFQHVTAQHGWIVFLLCPAGLALIVYLTRQVFPGAQGSGIPQAMAGLQMQDSADVDSVLSLRIAVGKFLLTLIGFASGASIGKEGPTVQIGCAAMNICGRMGLERTHALQRLLILAGGAAGITCAFNAPLAGIVFAIEEMARSFDDRQVRSIILAAFASGITLMFVLGYQPYFGFSHAVLKLDWVWLLIPVCAVIGGLAGGVFAQILVTPWKFLPGAINRLAQKQPVIFAAFCGLVLAAIGFASHGMVFDASYANARDAMVSGVLPPVDFAPLKFLATLVSYLSGIPGGIFAPSLAVGVGVGTAFVHLLPGLPVAGFAMVGMAGYFAGVVQSPLTAAVIVIEMTSDPSMSVPVGIAAILGTMASRLVCKEPVYHAMSHQFLRVVENRPIPKPNTVEPAPEAHR
ncbi:MAG TPA: chloride channel protein [Acidiphilium sp.]|jgi:H+/Cl- antiporter ClcA|uniref:chloride channel protein n=1 Tax=Acidiphilium sp. C61 TaxID=1671485 RepID=UPI00157B9D2B|nr:chloride channel protein [Acidiphilium sp. C61]HQU12219.1 chloride channel protein [Acidiphilium sp.]